MITSVENSQDIVNLNVRVKLYTCYRCGHVYGSQMNVDSACPVCTEKENKEFRAQIRKLERAVAAMKGVLNRRKK